ncbi:hypothetical protein MTR67_026084 [Solanum verrucosum]|uniref:Reverse transcriptase n=1 Tax=Solanum verrucosum TaxID=315347 RepID=A0AAF0QYA6_SOLVR|nr:hypothetical protein MTR67_026084 [Solanum verrucosum]
MQEVVKKEIIIWLDARVVYPIADSKRVSPVQCVPKKGENLMEVFMDDSSVVGYTFKMCLEELGRFLQRCVKTNLVLNWEKCHFMVKKEKLIPAPIIVAPDWRILFELMFDANDVAFEAILCQRKGNLFHPV